MKKVYSIQYNLIFVYCLLFTTCEIPDFLGRDQKPVYHLANSCYAIQAVENEKYIVADPASYRLADIDLSGAMKFFLKPTDLGSYLIYDKDGGYLSALPGGINRTWHAGPVGDWNIKFLEIHGEELHGVKYTLISKARFLRLRKEGDNLRLGLATGSILANNAAFDFIKVADNQCRQFPEADLNADISPAFFHNRNPNQPVRGFVDTHTHLSMPKAMGAAAMAGDLFHRYGIEHAMADCSRLHGPGGRIDLLEAAVSGSGSHSTAGYPHFSYWPRNGSITHSQTYYRWIERAYLGGLRILVTLVSGNESMCQLMQMIHPGQGEGDCKAEDVVGIQTDYIKDLQDYIDAQEGGPGKGWFRIVRSSAEARQVIAQNKLAVLLGTEYNAIFDCRVSADFCTPEYVDRKVDEFHEMGIRVVFPIHKHDNSFGGHKAAESGNGPWFNLTNKLNTGHLDHFLDMFNPAKRLFRPIGGNYWEYEECPEGVVGATDMADMQKFYNEDFVVSRNMLNGIPLVGPGIAKLFDWIFFNKLAPAPTYEEFDGSFHGCNIRGLQPAGRRLISKLMDKGMLIDIDHMAYKTFIDTLEMIEARNYSGIISSHGWTEMDQHLHLRRRLMALGGYRNPMPGNAARATQRFLEQAEEMREFPYLVAVGLGTDVQGLVGLPGGGSVSYPFKSYDGTVTFYPPKTGNRAFNYNNEGMTHYGLFPEWVEALRRSTRQTGHEQEVLELIWNSAEAYLQMWERAERGNPHHITLTDVTPHRPTIKGLVENIVDGVLDNIEELPVTGIVDSVADDGDNGNSKSDPAAEADAPEEEGSTFLGVSFMSYDLKYFVSEENGGYAVNANSTSQGHFETFFMMTSDDSTCLQNGSQVVLRTSDGYFWSAKPDGSLIADAGELGDWEKFTLTNHSDPTGCIQNNDMISLRGNHNRYIGASEYGQALANSGIAGNWEKLILTVH